LGLHALSESFVLTFSQKARYRRYAYPSSLQRNTSTLHSSGFASRISTFFQNLSTLAFYEQPLGL